MEWYWWVLEFSANFVETIMLVVFIQQFSEKKYKSKIIFAASITTVFIIISLTSSILALSMIEKMLITIIVGIAVGSLVFKGSVITRLLLPLILYALIAIIDLLTVGILQLVFSPSYNDYFEETTFRMLGTIISKVLLIIVVFFSGRLSKKANYKIPLSYSMILLLIPIISFVCLISIVEAITDSRNSVNSLLFTFSSIGLMFLNLLILYLFQTLMRFSHDQNKLQLMVQQTELINKHLLETNALQEETQRIWHDMKNHFTVIQWLVKSRNFEKLDQYMMTLNDVVASSMQKYNTGNAVIDALINVKAAQAKSNGIELDVNVAVPAKLAIDDLDLNVVLSNALDNAIEACRKLPENQKRIIGMEAFIKNDHFVLVVKNPFTGAIKASGDMLQTTKKEAGRHGIGMGNMKRAVEKYDGHIVSNYEDNLFILTAIMHCGV
jgi:sensor histidine kinase YesM